MRKILTATTLALATLGLAAAPAAAAPNNLPEQNPNKNSEIVPISCEAVNNGDQFFIWVPNWNAALKGTPVVGHPIGVDVPIGVQKTDKHGSFARTIECVVPGFGQVFVMPTGKP